jgi:ribonuclease HI
MEKIKAYIDGACSGNPGKSGIGVVFYNEKDEQIFELSHYLGDATNNIAEYQALISALKKAKDMEGDDLIVYTDSELLERQMNGFYKVRNEELKQLCGKAKGLIEGFKSVKIFHINREKNKYADKLARQAIKQV